jgi:uncharacterized damage-inducible protein DinB
MTAALSFRELLDYTAEETGRWEAWFRHHQDPAQLALPLGEGRWGTVGTLIYHIFLVERRYAERLLGEPVSDYQEVERPDVDMLFAVHREARERLERYLATADQASLDETLTFETILSGSITATRRKIVGHALLHGVRHWAQLATALRQGGWGEQWPHDLLLSGALP